MTKKHWTIAEDEILKIHYPNHLTPHIAAMLDKPVKALYNRARKLGLNKSHDFIRQLNTQISRSRRECQYGAI